MNIFFRFILPLFMLLLRLPAETGTVEVSESSAVLKQAILYFNAGNCERAVELLESIPQEDISAADSHLMLGKIYFYQEKFVQSLRQLNLTSEKGNTDPVINTFKSRILSLSGAAPASSDIQALTVISDSPAAAVETVESDPTPELWSKALDFISQGRKEMAYFYLKQLTRKKLHADLPAEKIFSLAGNYAFSLGYVTDASDILEKAVSFCTEKELFRLLYRIYVQKEVFEKAAETLEKALMIHTTEVEFYGNLALLYKKQKQRLKAADLLLMILRIEPDNALACYNLALMFYEDNKLQEALRYIEKIRQIIPPKNIIYQQSEILERKIKTCLEN